MPVPDSAMCGFGNAMCGFGNAMCGFGNAMCGFGKESRGWYMFDARNQYHVSPEHIHSEDELLQDDGFLCCATCRHKIVNTGEGVAIHGQHEHQRRNPHDIRFVFQCYRHATGCDVSGEPTSDYTWFAECQWQFASCSNCATHLGWYFSGKYFFFALIKERLSQCPQPGFS